ncbi:hypothetical protein L873DRAFT_1788049 [Choiromyces venosus 120613-1]|uniref:Carrier domain-containing protein n=1 Tax=Choiromyces venosus 120613-1 TaxID=1336337 RepID=A0A3N4JUJ3_9PEZI|nr:hypothetical protein L873DRAFT_1788049 [Choiromyces venosus 120613-1]
MHHYTAFPNLCIAATPTSDPELPAHNLAELRIPSSISKKSIIVSWSQILRGYIPADNVVFRVGDEVVNVDFLTGSVEYISEKSIQVGEEEGASQRCTGIYFQAVEATQMPNVCLVVNFSKSIISIFASKLIIPLQHLQSLASQLLRVLSGNPTSPLDQLAKFSVNPQSTEASVTLGNDNSRSFSFGELSVLNPHPQRLAGPALLHELISSTHRDHKALDFMYADGETSKNHTYEQLDILSTRFALRLLEHLPHGKTGHAIPVLLPQSPELYIALIGILRAGAAFVPLNLDAPVERIRFVVGDVRASVIVTKSSFSNIFTWENCPPTLLTDRDTTTVPHELKISSNVNPNGPAYIMYTSGSTGTPKGVTISHSAATQSLLAHEEHIPLFERFLQFAAPTFDVFVFEMFFPLYRGKTLVGCDRGRLLADLPGVINQLNIDGAELTPTVVGGLLIEQDKVPRLKVLLTIGEMLTRQVVDQFGGGVLQGMYGPTEAAIHCTLATGFEKSWKVGDIGMPFKTVSAFVLSTTTSEPEVLPLGWVGELAVGGYQLADGYLNCPELTKEVFIDSKEYGRLYRTGDRARMLPSGRIECLGRVGAGQVKLRGQRIELGEIEEVVLRTPGVKGAIASVLEGKLVAYTGGGVEREAIYDVCRKWLPRFMVPVDLVVFDELPRLPSGKADRKKLDKQYLEKSQTLAAENGAEELNDMDRVVIDDVKALLGHKPSRQGSLIAMGLDSIQAIRLVSVLRSQGFTLKVVDVLRADCVEGIAAAMRPTETESPGDLADENVTAKFHAIREVIQPKLSVRQGDIQDIIPCTSVQEAMLAETARDPGAYCNWILLELPLKLPASTIEEAFRSVIDRNEILRTGFVSVDDGFAQVIWKSSRPGQFSLADEVRSSWEVPLLEQLIEPPFAASLVKSAGVWRLSIHLHHAVYDGWCWEQVLSDFSSHLSGSAKLPIRPQYRDIVKYELSRSAESKGTSRGVWRHFLDGAAISRLPSFHGHTAASSGVFTETISLRSSRSGYEASARKMGVSPQTLIQTAWGYLLSLYMGSPDVVFGTVVSGRTVAIPGVEDILGPTIVTLPLRVKIGQEATSEDLIQDVHRSNWLVLEHSGLPLRDIRKVCEIEGTVFDSLLVWQQTLKAEGGSELVRQVESRDRLEFPLLLEIEPSQGVIQIRATYQHAVLPHSQIKLLLRQLDQLVSGIISQPASKLNNLLNSLNEDVLAIENPYPILAAAPKTASLAELVELSAVIRPGAIALDFARDIANGTSDSIRLTYAELNTHANKLAHHLISLGVIADELVSVCMEKSPKVYIAILAILKAGAGYLPLTPETPKERIRQILENARVRICLTTDDLKDRLGIPENTQVVPADVIDLEKYTDNNPGMTRSGDTLAYAVFTSGSTGVPKGVLITNANIVDNLLVLKELYPTNERSRLLQFCSIAFDVSVFEIFYAWTMGICLCSGTKDVLLRDTEGAINAMGITHLSMTPTVAALVNQNNVPGVKFLVTAGEALTRKVYNDWAGKGLFQGYIYQIYLGENRTKIPVGYGPSETVNICTVRPNVREIDHINNIGPPFTNTSAFVVVDSDEEFRVLPLGGIGELCFGGAQVGRGYLNMPELTSRKFISHPKYGRVYRSGDIGRMLPDGSLEFVGRQDGQVKIRGQRIELGEINSVLLRSKKVIDAAVTPVRRGLQDAYQLVAFIVPQKLKSLEFSVIQKNEGARKLVAGLFQSLTSFLPPYMVPAAIIPLTALPMTTQGKIDTKLLQSTYFGLGSNVAEDYTPESSSGVDGQEWTALEREVADVIAEVARVVRDEVGRATSIFRLGLDSISVIQLSSRLSKAGHIRLDVSQIMRNPTVSSIATLLQVGTPDPVSKRLIPSGGLDEFVADVKDSVLSQLGVSEDEVRMILPCTPLQEAMLSQNKDADLSLYYNHTTFNLNADPARLRDAWELMLKTHDIMRTCFCVTSHPRHAFAQVVLHDHQLPWSSSELEAGVDISEVIDQRITSVSESLGISKPPYAFSLLKTPENAILIMHFHHSLYDGFAMDMLLDDARRTYHGSGLPARGSFKPFLEYIEDLDLVKADDFWKERLEGLESSSFQDLTGLTATAKSLLTGMGLAKISCSRSLTSIEGGCRSLQTSLLALGQAAWARLLSVYSGEIDICFGNVVSGRTIPVEGVEDVIAPCFNTVPIRVQVSPDSTNLDIMNKLQSANAELLPFQLTPLRRIMTALQTQGQRLFDTLFILQHVNQPSDMEELWSEVGDRGEMDFSIVVELVPSRKTDTLEIVLRFRRDILLEEHVHVLVRQLNCAIVSSLDQPSNSAADFMSFGQDFLSYANSLPVNIYDKSSPVLLHTEFERHAEENSSRNALEYLNKDGEITAWTFEKLNQAVNQVAHYLISKGVKRDDAVPLCLEKSPMFYICVLGVLKAGSAFTPIDASLPEQRKMFMIEELGAKIVLATKETAQGLKIPEGVELVDIASEDLSSWPVSNLVIEDLNKNCLAYRIYTSGSTGKPKAVSLEIGSAVHTIHASRPIIPWREGSRLLQFAATTFDMCYYDCFMAWNYGFTLCSADKSHLLGDLEGTIKRMGATMLDLTPTVASTLHAENLPEVKLLYCIGEAMPQNLVNDWDGRCVNSYGPTEAAMCCTIVPTNKNIKSSNIGKPFDTVSFHVLTKDGRSMVPIFGSGELCIGGPQVAREYHNNPELTANRFINFEGSRIYRTGDLVRRLADGSFIFIGRMDDQIKIRGLRVELDEINSVLKGAHDRVRDATTIVMKHSDDSKEQLVSFLALEDRKQHGTNAGVLKVDSELDGIMTASRDAAITKLPRYMVPGVILIIDHIPLSAAGKIEKRSLETLFKEQNIQSLTSGPVDADDGAKWTEDERKIREAFSKISGVPAEQISRSFTIYEIGLDSISASQVAMELKKSGLQITVIDILERPSIASLSPKLNSVAGVPTAKDTSDELLSGFSARFMDQVCAETGLPKEKIAGIYPCTPVQEGMLSQFLRSKGELYFNHMVFELPENIDLSKLLDSWDVVFKSLDILRAGFAGVDDAQYSFSMIVHNSNTIELPWSVVPTGENSEELIANQKGEKASVALRELHLPSWSLTLFQKPSGNHLLMFSAHHALYDAHSLAAILHSVARQYSGKDYSLSNTFSSALSEIVKHTTDSKIISNDEEFWKKQLGGCTVSRFPNLCPLRAKSTASHVSSIEANWSLSNIEKACRQLGISVHAAGQAAWARILSAYSGEIAVTMGVVISGRSGIADCEDVVFPCIATLPSLCVLTGSNRELAFSIQNGNSRMLKHQHTPLRSIQKWLGHAEQSLFDTIFVYQKGEVREDEVDFAWNAVQEDAFVDYSISLELDPTAGDSLLIRATCRDNIMPREQTELLLRQFQAALIDILESPNSLSTNFYTFPEEILSCTPAKEDEIPTDIHLLHKFVEEHRQLVPDKVAFEFVTSIEEGCAIKETWSYTQLDKEGNKVANYLLDNGVKTGDIIGICFEKCPEASFAILGVLKAGCAFVALDYNAPIDRKSFIISDSKAKHLLTMDKFAGELSSKLDAKIISMQSSVAIKTASTETPEIPDLKPSDLCYCLYTSGTTGTPKGCELTHENAVQAMLAFQRLFSPHWDSESRFLQFASFHFDVSVLEQFWSWSVGVCVTSAPRDLIFQDLALTIRELRITHLDLTPSLASLIKPEDAPLLCKGVFITGGEQLKQEILDAWGEKGCIYNGYGPTEVTIGCTMYPRVPASGKPSNIGPQFDNVGSFVLVPGTDKPVLRGAIGELCVSGKLVGRGYLNRPSLTEEKFPYLEYLGTRIYRTGDLVRIFHDGTFDFAGRADDQVKLRGQRLEIGEINETLKQATTRARAVATLVLRHPKQQKDQLVSFIELETGAPISRSDIKVLDDPEQYSQVITVLADACRRKMPAYMVPTHLLPISTIPLSVNNKVDNKRLKELYHETSLETLQRVSRREDVEDGSWSDVEERLRIVLTEVTTLKASDIQRSSTIFELGLDSVSVVGLARRLKRAGFVAASVSIIMQYPVLTQLASELSKGNANSLQDFPIAVSIKQNISAFINKNTFEVYEQLTLDPGDVESIAPCTALQEGMIARFLDSEKPLYYNSLLMVINSPNDIDGIRNAWSQVISSTGILRTCFCETPDGYAQVVLKNPEMQWEEVSASDNTVQITISDKLDKHVDSNRDLYKVPLYLLVVKTPNRTILVLNIFHALYDGNSLPLILEDVQKAYHGRYQPRPHQFADIVGYLFSVDTAKARKFWEKTLAGVTPCGFPETSGVSDDGDHMVQLTSKTSIASVETICKKIGCTPQSVYQAAWASVLSGYIGLRPVFGTVVSGRSIPLENIEQTIGPLFNTIPSTLNLENVLSWEELIKEAHRFYSESIPYHHTPLRLVNKWMRATAEKPLFDTLFVYQKDEARNSDLDSLWEVMASDASADYPLALEVEQSYSNGAKFTIVSKGSLMTREMSSQLLERLNGQLRCIADNPSSKPSVVSTLEKEHTSNVTDPENSPNRDHIAWGTEANILRQTIATLAEVNESDITMDSSIFGLGLDSIEAIKLSSRLRRHGMKISVSNIMRNPTIRKLELFLRGSSTQSKGLTGEELLPKFTKRIRKAWKSQRRDDIEAIYPTTPLQEAMIAETLASDYQLYFNHDVLKLEDWVNTGDLRRAWAAVVERSEILRTSFFNASELFPESPCTFGQLVRKQPKFHWDEVTVANREDLNVAFKEVMQKASEEVDMLQEPPFRVTIVHSAKARHFILSISHALYDGCSIALLHKDVQNAYHDSFTQRPSCRLLLENVYSEDQKHAERFWKQILAGASSSSLRALSTEREKAKTHRREQNSSIPFSTIQSFCKHTGVTIQSLGQMCWALLLAHHLGESDVMFGTVLSGRDFDSAEEIMFPAMNTVPVRAIIHGTYKEMLQYMQDNSANVIKYQHTPLRKIQKLANRNGQRLFDTLFIYQRGREGPVDKQKAVWRSVDGTSDVEDTESLLQMLDSLLADIVNHINHASITYHETGTTFGNLPISTANRSSQIKTLNGARIDLGEVESVVKKSSEDISDCGAVVVEENGRSLLILFVTTTNQSEVSSESLIQSAWQKLPHWSLPSFIVPIAAIPHTDNQINRSELTALFHALPSEEKQEYFVEKSGEWTSLEKIFRKVLAKVSNTPEREIGLTQTIFHLGLDSISAISLSSELRKNLVFLSVAEILSAATIERMAASARTMGNQAPQNPVDSRSIISKACENVEFMEIPESVNNDDVEFVMPATPGQHYMISSWINSDYKLFMPTFSFKCRRVEPPCVLTGWEALVRQEPILRTTFAATNNAIIPLVQLILRNPPTQCKQYQSSSSDNDALIRFLLSQEQVKELDMSLPPVFLCTLNTPTETLIFITIHHALYDGVSLPRLIAKFKGFLDKSVGQLLTPDPEGPNFMDTVAFIQSRDVSHQHTFWAKYLSDSSSTCAPAKTHSAGLPEKRVAHFQPRALSNVAKLEKECRQRGISVQMVFLAAYAKVFAQQQCAKHGPSASSKDVIFGIYLSNRHLPVADLESMAAPTLNIVPLRVRAPGNKSTIAVARQIQDDLKTIGDPENSVTSLWQIREWTGIQADCFFNFLKLPGSSTWKSENDGTVNGADKIILEEFTVDNVETGVRSRVHFESNASMKDIRTNVDIEVAVRGDQVDMGVFSTTRYLEKEEAQNTIRWMCEIVEGEWGSE